MLVTEMSGTLHLYDPARNTVGTITGVPKVRHVDQGGLGDVVLHPRYADNQLVYISFNEADDAGLMGAAVARTRLVLDNAGGGALKDLQVIWRQEPRKSGDGHFGYRIAFAPDGKLFISSSERKEFDPAQDMRTNLGKIVRLNNDGTPANGNPFANQGRSGRWATATSWAWRSMPTAACGRMRWAPRGRLTQSDQARRELRLPDRLQRRALRRYRHPQPRHPSRLPRAVVTWTPVISPAGFIYSGDKFPAWKGSGFISGLSSMSLVRVVFDGETGREAERFDMQRRIREVEQGPDGAIWLLEDGTREGKAGC